MENNKWNFSVNKIRFWSFIGLLVLGGFIYLNIEPYLLPIIEKLTNLEPELVTRKIIFDFMWLSIIGYIIISSVFALLTMIFYGKKLKSVGDEGLFEFILTFFFVNSICTPVCLVLGLLISFFHLKAGVVVGIVLSIVVLFLSLLIVLIMGSLEEESSTEDSKEEAIIKS